MRIRHGTVDGKNHRLSGGGINDNSKGDGSPSGKERKHENVEYEEAPVTVEVTNNRKKSSYCVQTQTTQKKAKSERQLLLLGESRSGKIACSIYFRSLWKIMREKE